MAEKESGQNYKEARRIWRPAEEQTASNCFLWDSTIPAAAHFCWLLSPAFIISTSLNTGSCWHERDNTSSMNYFVHLSPLSLFVLFRHALHRWAESTDVFFLSLSVFLSLLTFPFFWFYCWFPSSCCCYSFFVCFPQEGWIWPVILSEITLKTTGLKTTQFGLFWQPSAGFVPFWPSAGLPK